MPDFGARDLTVIIPTRDRWSVLARTLEGLASQSVDGFETLVVVDGQDQTPPELDGVATLIKPHGGPGAARNAGVEASNRPLVLFLGDDMVPTPRLVEHHLARHNRDPDERVAVLGEVVWHPDVARSRLAKWLDWSGTQWGDRVFDGDDAGYGRFVSCNVSLKRTFLSKAGGFDEDFTYYYEDLDLSWRLNELGLVLRYEPAAQTYHLHRYDWAGIQGRFEGIARGERLMQQKHPEFHPWFKGGMELAGARPPTSLVWPMVVDRVPTSLRRLRGIAERRANAAYYQRLTPFFFHAWEADRGLEELKQYLGADFDEQQLRAHRALVDQEEEGAENSTAFYRTSNAYLYDLTAFALWRTKVPYLEAIRRFIPAGSSVLDYGCGIGSDGLELLLDGYHVAFADFDNPSTRFLKWRLAHRGLEAPVYNVDVDVPGGFDAAWSFDVIEHVDDPWEFLDGLERRAEIVAVNFLEDDPNDTHLHKPLPIEAMLDHAAARGLLWYRRYHGRSHLAVYRAGGDRVSRPSRAAHLRSRAERRIGQRGGSFDVADLDRLDRLFDRLRRRAARTRPEDSPAAS
jgi:GT2 family glycosyltransferase/SAM-dependent methyltransferase